MPKLLSPSTDRENPHNKGASFPSRYSRMIRINQFIAYWICQTAERTVWRGTVQLDLQDSDLGLGYQYILASNHQSGIDPFIIGKAIPPRLWPKIGSFRFLAQPKLFSSPFVRWPLRAVGGFSSHPYRDLPYGIAAAREYLIHGYSVVIFPEGSRSLPGQRAARRGVGVLGEDPRVRVIPVRIQWRRGRIRSYRIVVGRPLPPHQSAEDVLRAIYDLELP
jgi:1-acyl-sn-glycerol-3-phosphate acyltransferase